GAASPAARRDFGRRLPLRSRLLNASIFSFQRADYKPLAPESAAIELMASNAAISPQQFQNEPGGGQSQYSDVELMSSRQQSDSISTAKCCHFDALSAKPL